ncbi:hypothetical protein [Flammeovirga sp. SJP92]|uniref:hypothetical protein n=1 Tax=Flammeovirga sp. SJP92 TaxID=1775430 RepID=UPI000787876B|nr:hypothetical protein [Flammeovirga sp. SJP92]KXX70274.1 hypothetical protein AVL50_11755 [Flammeovirga sp. SJP92]
MNKLITFFFSLLLLNNFAHSQSLLNYSLRETVSSSLTSPDSVQINGINGTLEYHSIRNSYKRGSKGKIYRIQFMAHKYFFSEAEIQEMIQFFDDKYGLSLKEKGEYDGYCDYGYTYKGIEYCFASEKDYILFVIKDEHFYGKRRKSLLRQKIKKHNKRVNFKI